MANDNILKFPKSSRLDVDPDVVLDMAKGELQQVLVIGTCHNGDDWIASHTGNPKDILFMLERFKFNLLSGAYGEE